MLLHIADPDTQNVFETLTDTGTEHQHALNKLDAHFSIKKNVPFERSVFHSTTQHKSESIEQFVTRLRKLTLYCEYGDSTEEQIRDQVIATCNSTKLRRKLLTESDLTLEKVLQIGQSMEQAQHHLSTIEQKSTPSTSETSNQEELNVLPYHRRSPPKKPFQKIIRNKIKTLITETHISKVRNSILVTTKLNVVAVVLKGTEEMNVVQVKTKHIVNAIRLDILKECVDPKKNVTSKMPSTVPLLSCQIRMQTLILTMRIYMFLK